MRKILSFLLLILFVSMSHAQSDSIDHWETVYAWDQPARYISGNQEPPSDWNQPGFDDSSWGEFLNLIGYGPTVDAIPISKTGLDLSETTTFYTRTVFSVKDSSEVQELMFTMYHEDAFVAYLNGKEILRQNIGESGESTTFDQLADTTLISPINIMTPEFTPGVIIDKSVFQGALVNGENLIAIEQHNDSKSRNSHYYIMFLSAGIKSEQVQFNSYLIYDIPYPVALDSSNLPIVDIRFPDTLFIPDEPKMMATMKIIDNPTNAYNKVTDTTYDYDGHIGIELRGSSSILFYSKKSYGIETRDSLGENNNVELLGMPRENDWILYGAFGDKTMIRNVLTYKLSRDLGHYAPRTKYVDLLRNGSYRGTYVLMEKIKRDNDRVDIAGLRADELAGDSLTGGYIIKIDKKEGGYDGWLSEFGTAENENRKNFYQYVYPKWDEIQEEQKVYIQNFVHEFELSLRADNFDDPVEGYRKFINVESFIDYLIINELSKNMDGYRLSTYMYKDRDDNDGKLYMGPVWDYNLAYANYGYCDGFNTAGWSFDFAKNEGNCSSDNYQLPFWWNRLMQDEGFTQQLQSRWNELRSNTLSLVSINGDIDSLTAYISESKDRNYDTWRGMFSNGVWPNGYPLADSYDGEISYMKDWISNRLDWLDANMGETREKVDYVSVNSTFANEYIGIGAYPNPFSHELSFSIELEATHNVQIQIFNVNGQSIYTLADESFGNGLHTIVWSGESVRGGFAPSGVYFYRVMVDGNLLKTDKIIKQ